VVGQNDSTLRAIDLTVGATFGTEVGRATIDGLDPYDVAIDEPSHTAFVSLWGGQRIGQDKYADGVQLVDVTDRTAPMAMSALVPVGKLPEAELLVGGKLYVTSADADALQVIDVATKAVQSASLALGSLIGSSPNNLAIDSANGRIYVADANENAVRVLDLATLANKGAIPTGWYPTAVAVRGDGSVVIASAKGLGMGPTDHQAGKNDYMQGTLQLVPKPSDADLMTGAQTASANLARPKSYQVQLTCPSDGEKRFPLPPDEMSPTPIQHVFLVVRENKTYDSMLGDQPGTNGSATLALFGGDNTPNLHALAAQFTNLDNFYANAEQSLQGHEWTTAAFSNDYSEKAWATTWGRAYRPLGAFGSGLFEHLPQPPTDTAWTHLDKANIAYHNYGEVVNTTGALHLFDSAYPGVLFNLNEKDVTKAQFVIDNINDPTFTLERFTYMSLPNDHTYGTASGKPTPQSMVADNDEATGRLIDALSHSPYWPSSIVFVVEDDPSDGGDHVEGHRSPCVVMSPWVKHGYVSSVHYDDPALWATLDLLLGLKPMNGFDGNAAAMYDLFATTPDLTPYTFIPRKVPEATNASDAPFSAQSNQIDWTRPDSAPLGRILWNAIRGTEPPWGPKDSPRGTMARDEDD
jgi:YVTN family beta-propeller protein